MSVRVLMARPLPTGGDRWQDGSAEGGQGGGRVRPVRPWADPGHLLDVMDSVLDQAGELCGAYFSAYLHCVLVQCKSWQGARHLLRRCEFERAAGGQRSGPLSRAVEASIG